MNWSCATSTTTILKPIIWQLDQFKTFHITSDIELPEGDLALTLNTADMGDGTLLPTLLINGKPCGGTVIEITGPKFVGGAFRVGRFSVVGPVPALFNKGIFKYTNEIDRVEFDFNAVLNEQEVAHLIKIASDIE